MVSDKTIHRAFRTQFNSRNSINKPIIEIFHFHYFTKTILFNPILTGGVEVNPPPPCTKSATMSRPPLIATRFFMTFFFQVLRIFWYQVCENRTIGREVTQLFVLARRLSKFAQNPHFAYVSVQSTWKLLIFLKCSNSVFILSFWPFAQIAKGKKIIKTMKYIRNKKDAIHKLFTKQ